MRSVIVFLRWSGRDQRPVESTDSSIDRSIDRVALIVLAVIGFVVG